MHTIAAPPVPLVEEPEVLETEDASDELVEDALVLDEAPPEPPELGGPSL